MSLVANQQVGEFNNIFLEAKIWNQKCGIGIKPTG